MNWDVMPNVLCEKSVCMRNTFGVTLISEMDVFLRNGQNGDFFTKWSYNIFIYYLIFYFLVLIPESDNKQH